jgi:hypothetical protein
VFLIILIVVIIWLHNFFIMTSPTTLDVRTKDGVKFGKELREKEFLFEKGYLNLNHGESHYFDEDFFLEQ